MYDYSARYYEPAIGRFTSMDPLAEKYYSISPYAYCANNPINAIDVDGRDIIVVNNPTGGSGFGHTAMLVGNEKAGWRFISKEGRNRNYSRWRSNEIVGGPSSVKDEDYTTLDDFYKNNNEYTESVRFGTTGEQDTKAAEAGVKSAKSYYHFLYNNCADAVSDGLSAAGLDPGGVDTYYPSVMGGGRYTKLDSKPNNRFGYMKENNKNSIVPKDAKKEDDDEERKKKLYSWDEVNEFLRKAVAAGARYIP